MGDTHEEKIRYVVEVDTSGMADKAVSEQRQANQRARAAAKSDAGDDRPAARRPMTEAQELALGLAHQKEERYARAQELRERRQLERETLRGQKSVVADQHRANTAMLAMIRDAGRLAGMITGVRGLSSGITTGVRAVSDIRRISSAYKQLRPEYGIPKVTPAPVKVQPVKAIQEEGAAPVQKSVFARATSAVASVARSIFTKKEKPAPVPEVMAAAAEKVADTSQRARRAADPSADIRERAGQMYRQMGQMFNDTAGRIKDKADLQVSQSLASLGIAHTPAMRKESPVAEMKARGLKSLAQLWGPLAIHPPSAEHPAGLTPDYLDGPRFLSPDIEEKQRKASGVPGNVPHIANIKRMTERLFAEKSVSVPAENVARALAKVPILSGAAPASTGSIGGGLANLIGGTIGGSGGGGTAAVAGVGAGAGGGGGAGIIAGITKATSAFPPLAVAVAVGAAALTGISIAAKIVSSELDNLVDHLKNFNGAIAGEQAKYEAQQTIFSVKEGAALAPMLTAWIQVKEAALELKSAFLPVAHVVSVVVGEAFHQFAAELQVLAKAMDLVGMGVLGLFAGADKKNPFQNFFAEQAVHWTDQKRVPSPRHAPADIKPLKDKWQSLSDPIGYFAKHPGSIPPSFWADATKKQREDLEMKLKAGGNESAIPPSGTGSQNNPDGTPSIDKSIAKAAEASNAARTGKPKAPAPPPIITPNWPNLQQTINNAFDMKLMHEKSVTDTINQVRDRLLDGMNRVRDESQIVVSMLDGSLIANSM